MGDMTDDELSADDRIQASYKRPKKRRRIIFCGPQDMPGGSTYLCKLPRGHSGPHRGHSAQLPKVEPKPVDDLPF